MDFHQAKKGERGGGGLRKVPMPPADPIASFKSFVQQTGASK